MSAAAKRIDGLAYPGRVAQVSPLRVVMNGDTADAAARAMNDFTGASTETEVLVVTVERHRYAWRVLS